MKRVLYILAVGALGLITGCSVNFYGNAKTGLSETKLDSVSQANLFQDIYTDKSMYGPGEKVRVTCALMNQQTKEPFKGSLEIRLSKNGVTVLAKKQSVILPYYSEKAVVTDLTLPKGDRIGYAAEAYLWNYQNRLVSVDMTGIDASDNWRMYPRMGYIAGSMDARSKEDSRAILETLEHNHINTLYYQDMMDTHDTPLAGTVSNPAQKYSTLAKHTVSRQTLIDMLTIGRQMGMTSFAYDLMYGAYPDCESRGVSLKWGLYTDAGHQNLDFHGPLPSLWETSKLLLMNPGNTGWQKHFAQAMKNFITAYPFDGVIVDTLGDRGHALYDYNGNAVDLADTYAGFLKYLKRTLKAPVLFNPVGGYGYDQTVGLSELDYYFMECWPANQPTYDDLRLAIEQFNNLYHGSKGICVAAYMDYNYAKNGGSMFNEPGVRFTNSVILASGGDHLELGDNGMLSNEYYPGSQLSTSDSLDAAVTREYSFMTAYEHLLRGPGWSIMPCTATFDGQDTVSSATEGDVWAFAKENKTTGVKTLQLINLKTATTTEWVDDKGDQPSPGILRNQTLRFYVDGQVKSVRCATPDAYAGIMLNIRFKTGHDSKGSYVEFQLPYLQYWTMVTINS